MVDIGNGDFVDFHDAPGNHFQLVGVEMQEVQGGRHFHISKVISMDIESRAAGENSVRPVHPRSLSPVEPFSVALATAGPSYRPGSRGLGKDSTFG
jgi:hypothetical protein